MINVYQIAGFDKAAYIQLQHLVKTELSFAVTLRRHTQRYAYHQVDIRPTIKTTYRWTETQVSELIDFCVRHGLDDHMRTISQRDTWHPSVHQSGLNYVGRIVTA